MELHCPPPGIRYHGSPYGVLAPGRIIVGGVPVAPSSSVRGRHSAVPRTVHSIGERRVRKALHGVLPRPVHLRSVVDQRILPVLTLGVHGPHPFRHTSVRDRMGLRSGVGHPDIGIDPRCPVHCGVLGDVQYGTFLVYQQGGVR